MVKFIKKNFYSSNIDSLKDKVFKKENSVYFKEKNPSILDLINTAGDLILKKEKACLNVYLGDLKDPWLHFCRTLHQKPGTILKQFIQNQLHGETTKVFHQTQESPEGIKKHRFEVLLTPTEKAALELRSSQEGCSQRRWVIHAIRAALTKQAQFSLPELEVLGASNFQLLAIGRNLNQLVKAYHEGHRPSNIVPLIEKLQQAIDHHTKKVSDAPGFLHEKRWFKNKLREIDCEKGKLAMVKIFF